MHAPRQTHKNLALFDFDGTLCQRDSFSGFIFYALSKRHIVKQGLKIIPWIQAYYLNIYPAHAMRPKLFRAMFSQFPQTEAQQFAKQYAQILQHHLEPSLFNQLKCHQLAGDDVVIVSASIDIYLREIATLLNVDLICTHTEIHDGVYTGLYLSSDCSNEEKKKRVLQQYDLATYKAIYAYGNSDEDLAMLSLADYPYMVGQNINLPVIHTNKKLA